VQPTLEARKHPVDSIAIDLLMMIGSDRYTVPAYIREARAAGVSKRIPSTGIPQGIVPGLSRLFLWHNQVIPLVRAEGKSLFDLVTRLIEMGKLNQDTARTLELAEHWCPTDLLLPADYVPAHILRVTCIIQDLKPSERRKLEKDFEIEWQGAVFSWSYLGRVQCVVPENATEDDIPEHLRGRDDLDFVKVDYIEDDPQAVSLFDEE
jgi:hypothetical protein